MASISDWSEDAMLDWLLGGSAPTRPTSRNLALFTVAPNSETGVGGTEATGGGYARIALTFGASSGGVAANTSGPHTFVVGTNLAAGTYVSWGVLDNAGNWLGGDTLTASRTVSATGDTISFAVGAISVTLD